MRISLRKTYSKDSHHLPKDQKRRQSVAESKYYKWSATQNDTVNILALAASWSVRLSTSVAIGRNNYPALILHPCMRKQLLLRRFPQIQETLATKSFDDREVKQTEKVGMTFSLVPGFRTNSLMKFTTNVPLWFWKTVN